MRMEATNSHNTMLGLEIDHIIEGRARLNREQALKLYYHASIHDLGRWADAVARRLHGGRVRTYVIDRNINYTNVCSAHCTFCAFRRDETEHDAYTLTTDQLHAKVRELVDIGGTQVLLQGGMHPGLPIEFYEEMLRGMKTAFPSVHLHAFSPPEIVEFVAVFELPGFPTTEPGRSDQLPDDIWHEKLEAIMRRLMAAGLDSIPGGGGEIFAREVRSRIGLGKATAEQWLAVMSCAHRLGMHTSATMMFGHIEGVADRIDHMARVRDAQDAAIAGGLPGRYVSFIAWPFQRENTPLGRLPDWYPAPGSGGASQSQFPGDLLAGGTAHPQAGKVLRMSGATDYLRTQAIARLYMDNIHSIGSSWVTMGPKIGQLALFYGANDMGSVMMEENVVSAAGTTYCLSEPLICRLIRDAGFTPAQRDNRYNILKTHERLRVPSTDAEAIGAATAPPLAPDLAVSDWSKHRPAASNDPEPAAVAAGDIALPLAE